MSKQLNFKVSSAIKDIVGKDLITDDYVAIFELVKNAFDAHATIVNITFENIYNENAKIIISDNGKGMDADDLENKWLFLAYSAKKDGSEDSNFDYRNRIYTNKPFAGAKGIGRFSCDKLGKHLYLETQKLTKDAKAYNLITNWEDFEENSKKEFKEIPITINKLRNKKFSFENGTVLEISGLRSTWDRSRLLRLKDSLSKLINPIKSREKNKFSITLNVPDEIENDGAEEEYRKKVNGEIKNFIFETLGLKTTCITSKIGKSKGPIITELIDGGTKIYSITEKNNFELINNIEVTLYFLSHSAKLTFFKQMGLASRLYGNVFLYKNGFRVYPYGEPFSDPMGIDSRKSRKTRSRLGTGEIIGRIEILGNDNMELKEASSRGDGLIKNENYVELTKFFFSVLEKLETYVVDVQQWGLSIEDENNRSVSARITDLLSLITKTDGIINFEVPENFIKIIEVSQAESAESVVNNLTKIAENIGNEDLLKLTDKAKKRVKQLKRAKEQAEKDADEALELAEKSTAQLKFQISENLFLKSINTSDYKEMISLLHHIGIYAGTIDNYLKNISLRIQNNIPLNNEELYDIIKQISFDVKKILSVSTFATKAKFNLETESTTINIIEYVKEYVQNIIPGISDKGLNIEFEDQVKVPLFIKTKPIEISIIIANLVSNSSKAEAKNLKIIITRDAVDKRAIINFEDDGKGIDPAIIDKIYNIGFTTTDGSGIGLYHVKEIVQSLGASISAINNPHRGATFKIKLKEKL